MSLKDTDVRTPGDSAIAKKFKLSLSKVRELVKVGANHEKEHNTNLAKSKQVARDHIGERPDYYKMLKKAEKTPVSMKEETGVSGVRGFGNVTGDPAVGINSYINTNAMSYEDENGNKLDYIKRKHADLHNKGLGFNFFDPTDIKGSKNFMSEGISAGPERDVPIVGDPTGASRKVSKVEEDKDPCWKGYEMVGMKKKGGRKVPNCVPKEQVSDPRYTERPTYEQKDKYPETAERGIYQEGHIGFGHPYDWAGDKVKRKVYGTKPKEKPESNEPGTGDTYKGSKQGGKVKFAKPLKEVVATAVPPTYQPASTTIQRPAAQQARGTIAQGQTKVPVRSIAPVSQTSGTGTAKLAPRTSSGGYNTMKPTTQDVRRNISNRFNPSFSQQATGSMKPTTVGTSSSFSQGGSQIAQKMTDKLDTVSRNMPKGFVPSTVAKVAPTAAKIAGTVARVAGGPAATAAATVMAPTPAGEKKSEFERQSDVAKGISYKPQGRSISQYEKDVLTPKSEPKTVNAPTPPERPQYFTRGQAFQAARGEAGGGEGKFSYQSGTDTAPKTYQTNVSGEKYKPSSQLKQTSVQEDWQKVNRKDKTAGLSQKAVDAYKREHPGSKLQTAVTEKNPTGKRASRRKSFCSRMGGMKKRLTSAKTARDPDSNINKALRRWNCEESVINELKAETLGSYTKKAAKSRKKALTGSKPDLKTWGKRHKGIKTAVKKLTTVEDANRPDRDLQAKSYSGATGLTHTIHEETKMENKNLINEAIESIVENDLSTMKENLMAALQEKAIEKLEERKKEIAANYFAE